MALPIECRCSLKEVPAKFLFVLRRLAGEYVSAADAIFPGCILFRCATKAVKVCRYADVLKPQVAQERYELCLRQSAGDSTRPQVYVTANAFVELGIENDICKLQSSTRAQHAVDFSERFLFLRDQIEHAVGDDNIDAGIRQRERGGIGLPHFDIG